MEDQEQSITEKLPTPENIIEPEQSLADAYTIGITIIVGLVLLYILDRIFYCFREPKKGAKISTKAIFRKEVTANV